MPVEAQRLQKVLAGAGHGSRRQIEAWIRAGRLTVDGHVATLGERVGPQADVRLDGQPLPLGAAVARELLLYHKPLSEVTTRQDPQSRPTVFERLPPPAAGRWIVIGRLDVNTTGLLLFTTDGELAHRWMHPSAQLEREYLVRVRGTPTPAVLEQLQRGVLLEDGPARFDRIESTRGAGLGAGAGVGGGAAGAAGAGPEPDAGPSHSWYRVILHEGRNREVRRLWAAVGLEVSRLTRLRYGPVTLPPDLRPGQWRRLPPADTVGW